MNSNPRSIAASLSADPSGTTTVLARPARSSGPTVPPRRIHAWLELPDGRSFRCRTRTTVGRQADNDLVLATFSVSRRHALLSQRGGQFIVADLHSSNGTFVNDSPVTRTLALHDGDALRFGSFAARYRCRGSAPGVALETLSVHTRGLDHIGERACWLLLADVAGYSALSVALGARIALQRLRAWIAGLRPLIERHGGRINSYVGDALLAWWPADHSTPAQVRHALNAINGWRDQSPVPFRIVLHYGTVLFARSERGDELGGDDVNLAFRAEKVAKRFGAAAMLSEAAVRSLRLEGRCSALGATAVEGLPEPVAFFAAPITASV